jgi:hypothetical protein
MRSHPYTPPPPLPPIFDEIASIIPLPNQARHSMSQDDMDIPLYDIDPETSQLLPVRRRRHHVRVQGRLALVRSISTANLRSPTTPRIVSGTSSPGTPRFETALAGSTAMTTSRRRRSRRRSLDDGSCSDTEEDDERETTVRDRQLRGYGIGGVGNISESQMGTTTTTEIVVNRYKGRPTEVIYGPTPRTSSLNRLSAMYATRGSHSLGSSPEKRWWSLRDILGRMGDRKGKTRAA